MVKKMVEPVMRTVIHNRAVCIAVLFFLPRRRPLPLRRIFIMIYRTARVIFGLLGSRIGHFMINCHFGFDAHMGRIAIL